MRIRCGWKGWGAAVVLAAVAGVAAMSPTLPAGAAVNFSGVATADAARVTVIVPNAPATSSIVDTGVTSAQAVVTSAGTSRAYGSNPYPGENAVTLPGTLAGFGVAGVPAYPLYAESMNPGTPKTEIGQGPFHLLATSTATTSDGLATSGQAGEQKALLTSAATSADGGSDDDTVGAALGGGPWNDPGSVDPTSPTPGSSDSPADPSIAVSARPNCHTTSDGALPGTVNCVDTRRPAPTIPFGSCSGAM